MILILGGTTEGRKAVAALDRAGKPFFYSTRGDMQAVESCHAVRITGNLDRDAMEEFCINNGIRLMIDAAHPFASALHSTVHDVSQRLSLPVVRYERRYPDHDGRLIWCDDYEDAISKLKASGVGNLLALTGVQTISKMRGFWKDRDCHFRILNRHDSLTEAREAGFPESNIVFYENDGDIRNLLDAIRPDAIITKESGESGGFTAKTEEALARGIKVFAVSRPTMPSGFVTVTGEYGLRKAVESLVPGFFDLRSGFTTGACATAAAKAALIAILDGGQPSAASFDIPDGETMTMPIDSVNVIDSATAEATVIKDAGDDTDVTDGHRIVAKVRLASHGDVHFFGGEGVGTVTLPGTGIEVGQPAINPVPRKMIRTELLKLYPGGCDVTLSVPGGEELAARTFNPRIGITGGISIIGTSGIVMPFSNEAFIEAVEREIMVARASAAERVVLNSGARSEKAVKKVYPDLPDAAFIHYGNAIGEALDLAGRHGIKRVTVGVMIGKAVKLAEGNADTHSHKVVINPSFLMRAAVDAGCSQEAVGSISGINMAKELWSALSDEDSARFFPHILSLCKNVCRRHYPTGKLTMMLITDTGKIYCSQ